MPMDIMAITTIRINRINKGLSFWKILNQVPLIYSMWFGHYPEDKV